MGKKLAIGLILLGCIGSAFAIHRAGRTEFKSRYSEVRGCRTVEEISTKLGYAPGHHGKSEPAFDLTPHYKFHGPGQNGAKFVDDMVYWAGDDCLILAVHNGNGKVERTALVEPMAGRSWSNRLNDFHRGCLDWLE